MSHGDSLDSRAGNTKEILGFQVELTNPLNNILLGFPERKFSLSYACAEFLWYLSGANKIDMIKAYAPSYENFAENGVAYGAYGYRWKSNPGFVAEDTVFFNPNGRSQLEAIIQLLKEKPNTRQAIMTMWDSGDLIHAIIGDHKDLPCTLSLKFYVRNKKLYCIADMRSNDAWLGLPYDIFCFTTLQRLIAEELGLHLGTYIHQAGSEHIYERNFEKIKQILINDEISYPNVNTELNNNNHYFPLNTMIEKSLKMEYGIRTDKPFSNKLNHNGLSKLFIDLLSGCFTKWMHVTPNDFYNPIFSEYQNKYFKTKNG
jgi:thymidylate synthase